MVLKQYEINSTLATIREFIKANSDRATNAGVLLAQVRAALVGLARTYSSFVADFNTDAVVKPSDGVLQRVKDTRAFFSFVYGTTARQSLPSLMRERSLTVAARGGAVHQIRKCSEGGCVAEFSAFETQVDDKSATIQEV